MKQSLWIILLMVFVLCSSATSCGKTDDHIRTENNNDDMGTNKVNIKIGSKTFTATLLDNNSAKAFKELLPLTINMVELNGNEKYSDLPKSLPVNSANPGMIQKGDLMLYGSKTLVLFYKTFSTSYSYTKIGTVDEVVTDLASALGSGNVNITFEIK